MATDHGAAARALVLIGLALAISFATAGLFKAGLELALPHSTWLQEQVRLEWLGDATGGQALHYRYDLGRAARRHLLLVALVLFVVYRRRLPWADAARRGLGDDRRWRHAGLGLAVAAGLVLVYAVILLASGNATLQLPGTGYLLGKLLEYSLAAALIAVAEELLFRGLLFRTMVDDWGVPAALVTSSLVYAVPHCISGSFVVSNGWQPWIGGRLLVAYYTDSSGSPLPDLRLVVGLFLLGWLLAWLCLRTGSLWAGIGLHGGIVLLSKLMKKVLVRADSLPEWLLGDALFIVSGVVCWVLVLIALAVVTRITADHGSTQGSEDAGVSEVH